MAGGVKCATESDHSRTKRNRSLVLTHRKGLRIASLKVRTLNECGAASLFVKELKRLEIAFNGWLAEGEVTWKW